MKIQIQTNNSSALWSLALKDYRYSLFISPEWVESLGSTERKPIYIDFIQDNKVIAKLAGLKFESTLPYKRKLYFHAGPAPRFDTEPSLLKGCLQGLVDYAKQSGYSRIVMLSYDYREIFECPEEYHFSTRFEYIVDLERKREIIEHGFSKDVRRRYRNAVKKGFSFQFSHSPEWIPVLVQLLEETKRRRLMKGYGSYNYFYIPLLSYESFCELQKSNAVYFFIVQRNQQVFSVHAVLQRERKAYGLLIGTSPEGYQEGIPSYINYETIMYLHAHDYTYFNFGGISLDQTHKGLSSYKDSMGTSKAASCYGSTNFLTFPHNLVNPFMNLARSLPENRLIKAIQHRI